MGLQATTEPQRNLIPRVYLLILVCIWNSKAYTGDLACSPFRFPHT